jgi:uncharacterized protein (DUF58 family)
MVRTLAFAALWVFIFGTALSGGWSVMFKVSYLLLLLVGAAWLWTRLGVRWLEVSREPVSQRAQVGSELVERLVVRNQSWLPLPWVELRADSDLPDHRARVRTILGPEGEQQWMLRTVCRERGKYFLGPTTLTLGDPFGFCQRERVFPAEVAVIVYPQTIDLPDFHPLEGELPGGGRRRERVPFSTPMATSIRDYHPGDPYNRIHWPHSARLGRLLVKEFEHDPASDVWIVLDLDRNVHFGRGADSTEEYAVTIAASLAKHFLLDNRAVGLLTHGHLVHPDRGTRQLLKVLEVLAVARARDWLGLGELLARGSGSFARGTTALVVTPTVRQEWLAAYAQVLQRGVGGAVVLLEARTFGYPHSSLELVGALAAANIPTYLVKRGEPLDQALLRPYLGEVHAGAV